MADTAVQHAGHAIKTHDARWSGCTDYGRWIDAQHAAPAFHDARTLTGCYCPSDCGCKSEHRATVCGCHGKH